VLDTGKYRTLVLTGVFFKPALRRKGGRFEHKGASECLTRTCPSSIHHVLGVNTHKCVRECKCVCVCVCVCVCISIEALTTRKTALRYVHMIHIRVFVSIYIYYYEALGAAATIMRP
jgi:hypothetical protein